MGAEADITADTAVAVVGSNRRSRTMRITLCTASSSITAEGGRRPFAVAAEAAWMLHRRPTTRPSLIISITNNNSSNSRLTTTAKGVVGEDENLIFSRSSNSIMIRL